MSYILEALRRADAERQRGAVPGLNTPGAPPPAAEGPVLRGRGPLAWGLGALAVAAAAALGGLAVGLWRPTVAPAAAPPGAVVPPPVVVNAAPPAATPGPAGLSREAAPAGPSGPPPVVVVVPAPPPAAPNGSNEPNGSSRRTAPPAAGVPAAPVTAAPAVQAPVPVMPTPSAARAAAAPERVPSLAELPEAVRRQLPTLALGGSVYSEQPAQRLVIVNGQVVHEGDEAAPGVRVLQIRPRAVVFGAGAQRFELPL